MRINNSSHLCYSLNLFPREQKGYIETISAVAEKMCEVRKKLKYNNKTPFALGLWLDADSVEELSIPANLAKLKSLLKSNNLYTFTVNAFPYGKFHDTPVKDSVYIPNWTSDLRLKFTCKVADILAELLPNGITGSISTLPGAYKSHVRSNSACKIAKNLLFCANHLAALKNSSGKEIILGIEMEPDCIWESPEEFCEFRKKYLNTTNGIKYIGVCYDTCHQELLQTKPGSGLKYLRSGNVPIAKIQLSAALQCNKLNNQSAAQTELANFQDPIYLHQTRFFDKDRNIIASYQDIPYKKIEENIFTQTSMISTHFHMPLYTSEISALFKTAKGELEAVIEIIKNDLEICSNLEIETYTYSILPKKIKSENREEMVTDEYAWLLKRIASHEQEIIK